MSEDDSNVWQNYSYSSRKPFKANLEAMPQRHQDLLTRDEHFCLMPWIHLHSFPDGRAYPCCMGEYDHPIGNLQQQTMAEVWNDEPMRRMRRNMLSGQASPECARCHEQESSGMVSLRHSTSQHFGQHIALSDDTAEDGSLPWFHLRYYDIRFSNLCNFRCRSCGSLFSSNWYNDDVKMYGPQANPRIMHAGRHEDDMWEQMLPHIPYLDQIYFAGGEPLIMEEHYRLLAELARREMYHVRLIYNTNFSQLAYKDQDVLDLWPRFDSVSVGASLDGSGARGEYIRKGTDWEQIVRNRREMIRRAPNVDFYISPTVSIYNILHVTDFHRDWSEQMLIAPKDLNINIVQSPDILRVDALPPALKQQARHKIEEHIRWLEPQDHLTRATTGFRGLLNFMDSSDATELLPRFLKRQKQLDDLRGEDFWATFPELEGLREYDHTT
jgi:radical SAM protein with 4Fe4S-binding SPASM domain